MQCKTEFIYFGETYVGDERGIGKTSSLHQS